MNKTAILLAVVVLVSTRFVVSQPAHPIDCSDWESLEPGFSCVMIASPPCDSFLCKTQAVEPSSYISFVPDDPGSYRAVDNEGHVLAVRRAYRGQMCIGNDRLQDLELIEYRGSQEVVIGRFRERCDVLQPNGVPRIVHQILPSRHDINTIIPYSPSQPGLVMFDPINGKALIPVNSGCWSDGDNGQLCPYPNAGGGRWLAGIVGFATTFEILQTYTPVTPAVSFRVPALPEGFHAADHFNTYYGAVTRPLDLSQAQSLQCSYPDTPPAVGDYMSIATPVPTPTPGNANYVLTAVTYQGQTRAGRQAIDGTLHGRDASVLPACVMK